MKASHHARQIPSGLPIAILGVPFDPLTTATAIGRIEEMIATGCPHYAVTANVDFLVQALEDVELRRILLEAHMVLCDGTPLVWASKFLGNRLPERVAGSDLVPPLLEVCAAKGYKVFFLGSTPESTSTAVAKLKARHPDLQIAGHLSPPFCALLDMDHDEIKEAITSCKPDVLLVAFGCPKQEKWINMHYRSLGVPVSIGVGATIDFLSGQATRAPKWMQRTGTEWIFRMVQEPRRLFRRYATDLWVFSRAILRQWWGMRAAGRYINPDAELPSTGSGKQWREVELPQWLSASDLRRTALACEEALANSRVCLLNLSRVEFIDSTGIGLLIRLQKQARIAGRKLVLLSPSPNSQSALRLMRVHDFFTIARSREEARRMLDVIEESAAVISSNTSAAKHALLWRGEITAANADSVWQNTIQTIETLTMGSLVIDLGNVRFIDSSGVGLMLRLRKQTEESGLRLRFINPQPNVRNVLHLARLETVLLQEAL